MQRITTVGLITYNHPHLKTKQIVERISGKYDNIKMYALPFASRKERTVLFHHRPNQTTNMTPTTLAKRHDIEFIECDTDLEIDDDCDCYLILGAGILSEKCVENKKIINAHPGLIPASRGLDSFKWAIYNNIPVGNTLHYIDKYVDSGTIISTLSTPVYKTDCLQQLAQRHYEREIDILSNFDTYLKFPVKHYTNLQPNDPTMRMDTRTEEKMLTYFRRYLEQWSDPMS